MHQQQAYLRAALLTSDELKNCACRRLAQSQWEIRQSLLHDIVQAATDASLWVDAEQFDQITRPFLPTDHLLVAADPDLYRALDQPVRRRFAAWFLR